MGGKKNNTAHRSIKSYNNDNHTTLHPDQAYYKTSKENKVTVITQFNNRLIGGSGMSVADAISEAAINEMNHTPAMIKPVYTTIFIFICIDSIDTFHLMNCVE